MQDLRYALRTMARNPGFTIVALVILMLGIGANSALFSVVHSVLLDPLPYPDSERLMQIGRELPMGRSSAVSATQFLFWEEHNRSFETMATYDGQGGGTNLVEGDRPEFLPALRVSSRFFEVLGAPPQIGRDFAPEDGVEGAAKVAIISDGLWRRRFGGDPLVLGRVLRLSGVNHTVIGVAARGFQFNTHGDIWTPLTLVFDSQDRGAVFYVVARLKPEATLQSAQVDMTAVAERLRAELPDTMGDREKVFVRPHLEQVVGSVRPALLILSGAVGLVLLIACANVANLLLARATGRKREIALRATLGAGRWRIVRQLMTECLALSLAGGSLGFLLSRWGISALIRSGPGNLPRAAAIEVDGTVFLFTLVVAVVSVVLFGLFPALQATKVDLHEALKEGSSRAGVGLRGGRARGALVVSEIALALVLLVGATLLIDSFLRVTRLNPGYDYDRVLTMKMSFGGMGDLTSAKFTNLTRDFIERLEASPGIERAATISTLPLEHGLMNLFNVQGRPAPDGGREPGRAQWRIISNDYFQVMGIPLRRGRTFTDLDTQGSERVTIINDALARRYFADEDPIGRALVSPDPSSDDPPTRIVGVVGDVRELALDRPATPTMFVPAAQEADEVTAFIANILPTGWVVRTAGDPLTYGPVVQREMLGVNRELPVSNIRSMEQVMGTSIATRQFNTLLLALFAGLALLLAVAGIYGVMSYSVAQRTHEIGVRMALGAARGATLRMIFGQGMRLAAIGVVVGILGAFALTRLMLSLLFEISATDPLVFLLVTAVLFAAAAVACVVPALRATRVDPLIAMRSE
jgi:predicted permease